MDRQNKQKAFIFDLDGVLINNEPYWEKHKKDLFTELFGEEVYAKMGSTIGLNMHAIYERAVSLGATVSEQQIRENFHKHALSIYGTVPITLGIEELGEVLIRSSWHRLRFTTGVDESGHTSPLIQRTYWKGTLT